MSRKLVVVLLCLPAIALAAPRGKKEAGQTVVLGT